MAALIDPSTINWIKRGYVSLHPDDTFVYPRELFEVDPMEFTPAAPCRDWGLQDPNTLNEGVSMMDYMMAKIAMQKLYLKNKTPFEQYVAVLAKKKQAAVESEEVQAAMQYTFRILVSLSDNERDCWREIIVPGSTSLAALHDCILAPCMGWSRGTRGHVFQDPVDGAVLGPKDQPGLRDMLHVRQKHNAIMEEKRIPIASLLRKVGDYCWYTYDLGDHWEHRLDVVEVIPEGDERHGQVMLLQGQGACPPEERKGLEAASGCEAYARLLAKYRKDHASCKKACAEASKAPNYSSRGWRFEPLAFDVAQHRAVLTDALKDAKLAVPQSARLALGSSADRPPQCWRCGERDKPLQRCGKCGTASYCSRDCQVTDWKEQHKHDCKQLAAERATNATTADSGTDTASEPKDS